MYLPSLYVTTPIQTRRRQQLVAKSKKFHSLASHWPSFTRFSRQKKARVDRFRKTDTTFLLSFSICNGGLGDGRMVIGQRKEKLSKKSPHKIEMFFM
jgi:hypothetical protein